MEVPRGSLGEGKLISEGAPPPKEGRSGWNPRFSPLGSPFWASPERPHPFFLCRLGRRRSSALTSAGPEAGVWKRRSALQAAQIHLAGSAVATAFSTRISSRIGSLHRVSSRIGSPNSFNRVSSRISLEQSQSAVASSSRISLEQSQSAVASAVPSAAYAGSAVASSGCFRQTCTDASSSSNEG